MYVHYTHIILIEVVVNPLQPLRANKNFLAKDNLYLVFVVLCKGVLGA